MLPSTSPTSELEKGNGLHDLADCVFEYMSDMRMYSAICARHEKDAAIHTRGKSLQVYRLFDRSSETSDLIRNGTTSLPSWEGSAYWKYNGKTWMKNLNEVKTQVQKHDYQNEMVTHGFVWDGIPMIGHGYKHEPDVISKLELIVMSFDGQESVLPLEMIAKVLQCHEYIVPDCIVSAKPPYERHEHSFDTISEYLHKTMKPDLLSSICLPTPSSSSVSRGGTLPSSCGEPECRP